MDLDKLIDAFKNKELQTIGTISIYGNYFGKPGDTISKIKDVSMEGEILVISLSDKTIFVSSPKKVSYNYYSIDIEDCDSVKVDDKEYPCKENEKAFHLYNWSAKSKGQ
ncbi:hypothetical protein VOI54_10685 [Tamlana sp. 2201CG12-4]|uniref:hypothetical protein n=1 Tax=Tamlana sp. 2201CG12-4 TaxID=3112582 RepID=UPI002DBF815D|nr:hypothetical protein [Tamlana sp. 2201CG12-4]MEC3907486.1 hypothetical protein [Tamlana sp. 2201CG12-4]